MNALAETVTPAHDWDGVARSYIPRESLQIDPGLRLHASKEVEVDPITFEVVRYALLNANFEHCRLIQRLSVSPVVMISRDAQASVLLEDGDLFCLGPNVQYFSNSQSLAVKWILENRSTSPGIRPGDMFLCNDPFIAAPHQQDTCLALPLFVDGELFCWVANTLHYSDVGGSSPGSFCIGAKDAWDDPPAFPAIRLVEQGTIRRDVEEIFVRQSRLRTNVLMDLRAAVTSNQVTGRRILDLVERYGADTVKAVMRRTSDAAESLFVERLRHVPDGKWSARGYVESCVPGDSGIYKYQVNLEKRGDRLFVDNEGTGPQAGAINITYVAFAGSMLTALVQSVVPELAGCFGGAYRRVTFRPRSGLLNCAEFPAAVSPSGAFTSEMTINLATHVVARMLSCGDDDARSRVVGVPQPTFYASVYSGLDETGAPFVSPASDNMIGTSGGMPRADGADAGGHYWMPGAIAENVEQVESCYPLLYLYRRFLPGGADGAGRTRGGLGTVQAMLPWNARHFEFALAGNESFTRANGLLGGNPGTRAWTRVANYTAIRDELAAGRIPQSFEAVKGEESVVSPKALGLVVGDRGIFEWSGSATAGCGDPLLRDPRACLADVLSGLFEPSVAASVYGVVLERGAEGYTIDVNATRTRRLNMLESRAGHPLLSTACVAEKAIEVEQTLKREGGRWFCGICGHDHGETRADYKTCSDVVYLPITAFAAGFESPHAALASQMELRMFLCPSCGVRLDTEIARREDDLLHDMTVLYEVAR